MPKEEVVLALDAIQDPISLFEPVYNDSGDSVYVMDQVSDDKNEDEVWLNEIALREGMRRLGDREKHILRLRFFKGRIHGGTLSAGKYRHLYCGKLR